ncbi:MAG: Galactokinase [Candidatus Heimdallarchaeota archaeon LC_3]|nr:MAG: Galactokinase [Candidatus Heimdallarchaeota archaeon LC_3]
MNKSEYNNNLIHVSAPGRIVLGGEHQDYFNLPVISAGISLRIEIRGKLLSKPIIQLRLHNMHRTLNIPLQFPIPYRFRRSYLQSGLNNIHRAGYKIPGFEAEVISKIPRNAGLSSSSALCVAWAKFLLHISSSNLNDNTDPQKIAGWAHKFEVAEFNEPGGKQDQLATALGGINYIKFPVNQPAEIEPIKLDKNLTLVIGHSLIRKNTLKTILRIRRQVADALTQLRGAPKLDYLKELNEEDIPNGREYQTLRGVLRIRDLTQQMKNALMSNQPQYKWGELIQKQHSILRDNLRLSIPRIERMVSNAVNAGAFGAKINGSGEGGCMFALCHKDETDQVAKAIEKAQGSPFIVHIDEGVRLEKNNSSL